jgi:hypothetical protein
MHHQEDEGCGRLQAERKTAVAEATAAAAAAAEREETRVRVQLAQAEAAASDALVVDLKRALLGRERDHTAAKAGLVDAEAVLVRARKEESKCAEALVAAVARGEEEKAAARRRQEQSRRDAGAQAQAQAQAQEAAAASVTAAAEDVREREAEAEEAAAAAKEEEEETHRLSDAVARWRSEWRRVSQSADAQAVSLRSCASDAGFEIVVLPRADGIEGNEATLVPLPGRDPESRRGDSYGGGSSCNGDDDSENIGDCNWLATQERIWQQQVQTLDGWFGWLVWMVGLDGWIGWLDWMIGLDWMVELDGWIGWLVTWRWVVNKRRGRPPSMCVCVCVCVPRLDSVLQAVFVSQAFGHSLLPTIAIVVTRRHNRQQQ